MVTIRHAWHIEHKSALGSCPDFSLIEALPRNEPTKPTRKSPSKSWSDYVAPAELPKDLAARVSSVDGSRLVAMVPLAHSGRATRGLGPQPYSAHVLAVRMLARTHARAALDTGLRLTPPSRPLPSGQARFTIWGSWRLRTSSYFALKKVVV